MSHTEDWQVCDTGEKQHGTEKTVTRQGSRPQFGGTVMTAFLLHNQNEELPANTQVDEAESRDFEGQGKQCRSLGTADS